ncbi:MAG: AsmA family protein, partial [Wenzhouxiangella sp.]
MLRRIILLVSMIVVLLVVAVAAALVLIDPDDYRDEIAERASERLDREVRLDGPIDLKVFPWLAFEVDS